MRPWGHACEASESLARFCQKSPTCWIISFKVFALIIYFYYLKFQLFVILRRFPSPPVLWEYIYVYTHIKQFSRICFGNLFLMLGEGDCRDRGPSLFTKRHLRGDSRRRVCAQPPSALPRLGLYLPLEEVTMSSQPQPSQAQSLFQRINVHGSPLLPRSQGHTLLPPGRSPICCAFCLHLFEVRPPFPETSPRVCCGFEMETSSAHLGCNLKPFH